jgi:two-component system, sensor histidine kinase YesM
MKYIAMKFRKLIVSINNVTIKRKLIYMYIFCVLIPIVAINSIFYLIISRNVKEQALTTLNESMNRIKISYTTEIEQCMQVYRTVSLDSKLENALSTQYKDVQGFYEAYQNYMQDAVAKFQPVYGQIRDIGIYTKNSTIIDGGNYHYLNLNVLGSQWYNRLQSTSQNVIIYPYMETYNDTTSLDTRYLSVIGKLYDYKYENYLDKILKIDLKVDSLLDAINIEKMDGLIYLVDDNNRIIFSNNREIYYSKDFKNFTKDYYSAKDIVITSDFEQNGNMPRWKLIGVFPEKSIMKTMGNSRDMVIAVALCSLILASLIILIISSSIKDRLEIVSRHLKDISNKKFNVIDISTGEDEIGTLIKEFNNSTTQIKNLIEVVYETEIEKTKAELGALQSQVNPHMLYNILNTVRLRSVLKGETETAEIIKYMAKLFRRFLSWEEDLITIKEEIELTRDFLEIQKYRFGEKLNYRIDVDEGLMEYKVPKMCIQTLAENSSVHGIENIDYPGFINVDVILNEDKLIFSVSDNGIGIDKENLEQIKKALKTGKSMNGSYGIANVYKRLKLYFGDKVVFNINSELNKGTIVAIAISLDNLTKN